MSNSQNLPILKWTSHPLRDNLRTSFILLIFILLLSAGLWRIAVIDWEMPLFYYLGLLIFFLSLAPYFIPTTYEFFEEEIVIYYWFVKMKRPYSSYGCYYVDKKGVMLSTFKMPRRLDAFRGLNIRFSKNKAEKPDLLRLLDLKIGNRA